MNPLLLMSIPLVLGFALFIVGLLPTIYELGSTELEQRSETAAQSQTQRARGLMSWLDWEESHPAAHWLSVLGAGACFLIIAVVLAARGGPVEKVLASGQALLGVVFLARGEFFEEIAQRFRSMFRDRLTDSSGENSRKTNLESRDNSDR